MSRKKRNVVFAIVLLLLAVIIVADRIGYTRRTSTVSDSLQTSKALDLEKYHGKIFEVVKVVDGDTIDIDIPDGKYDHTRIRLWGVDTPETEKSPSGEMYYGDEASAFTKQLTLDKKVTVYLDKGNDTRGKYGRLLAYVQLDDRSYLNERLLTEGYAYADLRFSHSFKNKYRQLEAAARSTKQGLWRDVTREQLPTWLQKEKPKLLVK